MMIGGRMKRLTFRCGSWGASATAAKVAGRRRRVVRMVVMSFMMI